MLNDSTANTHEFPQPNDHEIVWRYMSFGNYFWLLENEKLYQPNISSFNDVHKCDSKILKT